MRRAARKSPCLIRLIPILSIISFKARLYRGSLPIVISLSNLKMLSPIQIRHPVILCWMGYYLAKTFYGTLMWRSGYRITWNWIFNMRGVSRELQGRCMWEGLRSGRCCRSIHFWSIIVIDGLQFFLTFFPVHDVINNEWNRTKCHKAEKQKYYHYYIKSRCFHNSLARHQIIIISLISNTLFHFLIYLNISKIKKPSR